MKAIDKKGVIKTYGSAPSQFQGNIKHYAGGFNLLTDEEQQAEGLYDVVTPEYNEKTQELGDIYWDTDNGNFTYPVVDKTFVDSLENMKTAAIIALKNNLNAKLAETDWYYIRKTDTAVEVPNHVQGGRDEFRSNCSTKENQINALTEKADVANFNILVTETPASSGLETTTGE
jgi:hypothetical protein